MKTPDLKDLLSQIKKVKKETFLLTPINLEEEKAKFLKQPVNNPQFVYPPIPSETFNKFLNDLENASFTALDELEEYFYQRQKREITLKLNLLLNRGNANHGEISEELYQCNYAVDFLQQAEIDRKLPGDFGPREKLSSAETMVKVEEYLEKLNIGDWIVELSKHQYFNFRVKSNQKKILIGKDINWDFCDLDNSLAHEIDGHVIRAVNATHQINPLLRKPFPFYSKTEEGLACYLTDYFSTTDLISRKHHALKYLAGKLARTGSFCDCFNYFMDNGFTPELAFRRAFRLKRGFEDTSIPGCYAHEAMYYEGMLEVKNYLEIGGDLKKLYSAKAGLEDLKFVPVVENVKLPGRLAVG